VTPEEIDSTLAAAESQIATGRNRDLRATGFWRAVGAVKAEPSLVGQFADRIGAIDRAAFRDWARITIPVGAGTALAIVAVFAGITLIALSATGDDWASALFLGGTGVLIAATHGLGHLAVGYFGGIRFYAWFIGKGRPQPGVKTDYATYVSATPRSRAWMHASGAIVTKAIPFLLLPWAIAISTVAAWVPVTLIILGIVQIITDIAWSTRSSDWAKFKREMKYV
jgi:hypothetical protein